MQTLPKERRFETMSYLPPLSDAQIERQIAYYLDQGFIPAIEFDETADPTTYYWTMWKLPLFGARSEHRSEEAGKTSSRNDAL